MKVADMVEIPTHVEESRLSASKPIQSSTVEVMDEDAELHGVGKGLAAVVGGGTAMAFTAYIICVLLLPYFADKLDLFTTVLIGVFAYALVILGAWAGSKVLDLAENHEKNL
jgi:hypothetical protein